ncbi:CoA-binding protein [Salsipaludibacter albus]|uniref:CoA-binding protein n=1 Tax=Salsipaludibacter albus TaxID=2849650 RepID=UPI001EE3FE0A
MPTRPSAVPLDVPGVDADDVCPVPDGPLAGSRDAREQLIDRLLAEPGRVAIVGLSDRPWRASHEVAAYLQSHGWEIVPVNPEVDEVLGVPAVDTIAEAGPVDLVDVFRRVEHLPGIASEAAAAGAPALWNQLGLRSPEAAEIAAEAGMDYVEDRCTRVELMRRS